MTDLSLTDDEERAIRQALMDLPKVCRYHGDKFEKTIGPLDGGVPRCESCRVPWRAREAWNSFTAAADRRDARDRRAERQLSKPATQALDNVNWTV